MTESFYNEQFRDVEENYKIITENIAESAVKSQRNPVDITLLAATKTVSAPVINHAICLGLGAIGENRVQELLDKYPDYNLSSCDLQFIGRLQTNKIKYIADKVSQIQSVDSMSQIEEICLRCRKIGKLMNLLVEVNIGREENKGGVLPEKLFEFIDEARQFKEIHINGLMTIPPICDSKKDLCNYFYNMNKYYVDIRGKKLDNVSMSCLSMGMSADYEDAILCGANMVRVGSSLFGKRQ